jgi:beta-N-acetylhexosaminidase
MMLFLGLPCLLPGQESGNPVFAGGGSLWVDSVYQSLTPRERIAQLIMVAAFSNKGPEHQAAIERLIRDEGIGGLAFFQGGPVRQVDLVNRYQSLSKVPLLMAMDAEWGLAMRLDSTPRYPFQMALGAIQKPEMIRGLGAEVAAELKATGIQMNFAPVVDVNSNPDNPVINYRSFGEDPRQVAGHGLAYMNGMQENGILAVAKHFPGHGDAGTDSHLALPVINRSRAQLDSVELYPFKQLIGAGLASVMIAHLNVPALGTGKDRPTTLSSSVVNGLLRDSLGFKGLVVTDALNMKGVTASTPPGEIEVEALQAGNDLLIYVTNVRLAITRIEKAIRKGILTEADIEKHCKAVLRAKYWAGLDHWKPLPVNNLVERLNSPTSGWVNRKLVEASLTVVQNRDSLIPLSNVDHARIASVRLGYPDETLFERRLDDYARIDHFSLTDGMAGDAVATMLDKLQDYQVVIVGVHGMDQRPSRDFGITPGESDFIAQLSSRVPVIAVLFGNPYALAKLQDPGRIAGLVVAYQESDLTLDLSAQLIFGGVGATARLPVSVAPLYKRGDGTDTRGGIRFSFTTPDVAGINPANLKKIIDSVANEGIRQGAYPGCEVLAARNGQIFFQSCYGHPTYESDQPDRTDDLFDMASVTKVSAPLPSIMELYEEGKIDLDAPFSRYWPAFKGTDKERMTVRQVLSHVAGLAAWIPFWRDTKNPDGSYKNHTLSPDSSADYPVRVSAGLWRYKDYDQTIYQQIKDEPNLIPGKYVYSDLSFHLWPKIIAKLSGSPYEDFICSHFYDPLGALTLTYNPLRKFPPDRIIPTERDTFFRMELLHGYVHDEGAAMLGGVSGNAGLFGTALDLAKLFQMYLWKGSYGGKQYFRPETIAEFTRYQYKGEGIRRGLGFDKPMTGNDSLNYEDCYPCPSASPASFGHSGYTGTFVWVDPVNGLLFVFLSNRVYPTRNNSKLTDLYIRKTILQTLYDAVR